MMQRRQLLWALAGMSLACDGARKRPETGKNPPEPDASAPPFNDTPLLLGLGGLERLRARATSGVPAYRRLIQVADAHLGDDKHPTSAENLAVAYLASGQPKYATAARAVARQLAASDVRNDSYLHFGDILRPVALVLDHCRDATPAAEQSALADFLARWCHELWFDNQGSGWGLADPGNNYHMAFIEGTAFAAYALARRRDGRAAPLFGLLRGKLEGPGGVFAYLDKRGAGGDWHEGVNYGQRAKQRLFMALALMESMGGPPRFAKSHFFRDAILYAVYQLQPDQSSIYPSGDLARDSAMRISPYDRDYVQLCGHWVQDERAKALARWYLTEVVPSYDGPDFAFRGAYYKDLLFPIGDGPKLSPRALPRSYVAPGTGWLTVRSSWDRDATCLCVAGGAIVDQSHAHIDVGSFTLFKGGWQAADAGTYSRSGLLWQAGAHNLVHVEGHERLPSKPRGLTHLHHGGGFAYVRVDCTELFRRRHGRGSQRLLDSYVRQLVFVEPDTVVVYDRVTAKKGVAYQCRLHFPEEPEELSPSRFAARHGRGSISLEVLRGGTASRRPDGDLDGGGSRAWRVQIEPDARTGEFLTVVRVDLGDPPAILARLIEPRQGVVGVVLEEHLLLFREGAGKAQSLSYQVPAGAPRTHLLFNASGSFDVDSERDGDSLRVNVRPGSRNTADKSGILRFRV